MHSQHLSPPLPLRLFRIARLFAFGFFISGVLSANAFDSISSDDTLIVIEESKLKVQSRIVGTVKFQTRFSSHNITEDWVWYKSDEQSGWIARENVIKDRDGMRLVSAGRISVQASHFRLLPLPKGTPTAVQLSHGTRPVDLIVLSDEGKLAFEQIARSGNGRIKPYAQEYSITSGELLWNPPDHDQYYLLLDNTRFPDQSSAKGRSSNSVTIAFWSHNTLLEEPLDGRGIILGRVAVEFDNYDGHDGVWNGPTSVTVRFTNPDSESALARELTAREIVIPTDKNGFFALANQQFGSYEVRKARIGPYTMRLGARLTQTFSHDSDSASRVFDVGTYVINVDCDGGTRTQLTTSHGPGFVPVGQSALGKSITPLERHEWFLRTYWLRSPSWCDIVRSQKEKRQERDRTAPPAPQNEKEQPRRTVPRPPRETPEKDRSNDNTIASAQQNPRSPNGTPPLPSFITNRSGQPPLTGDRSQDFGNPNAKSDRDAQSEEQKRKHAALAIRAFLDKGPREAQGTYDVLARIDKAIDTVILARFRPEELKTAVEAFEDTLSKEVTIVLDNTPNVIDSLHPQDRTLYDNTSDSEPSRKQAQKTLESAKNTTTADMLTEQQTRLLSMITQRAAILKKRHESRYTHRHNTDFERALTKGLKEALEGAARDATKEK